MTEPSRVQLVPRKKNSVWLGLGLIVLVPVACGAYGLVRGFSNPCGALLDPAALHTLHEDSLVHARQFVSTNGCSLVFKNSEAQAAISVEIKAASSFEAWKEELAAKGFTTESLALGDKSLLASSPSANLAPTQMVSELVADHVANRNRQPAAPALFEQGVALVVAGPNVMRLIVRGPPERVREVLDAVVAPKLQVLREASF